LTKPAAFRVVADDDLVAVRLSNDPRTRLFKMGTSGEKRRKGAFRMLDRATESANSRGREKYPSG